jgi:sugar phosphate isomerase/epimerase
MIDRRAFLTSMVSAIAAGKAGGLEAIGARPQPRLLPIGFSTLGCPTWSWPRILQFAQSHGFPAIELRGLEEEIDLPKHPVFAPDRIAETKRELSSHSVRVVCLGSSANMHEQDPAKHAAQLADARAFVDLASALGAPYVRVFGNNLVKDVPREVLLAHIAKALRELGEYAGPRNVSVLLESHGDFTDSPTLVELMQRASSPAVGLLWDAHHTFVQSKEDPAETARQIMPYVKHTHLKDSRPDGTARRYVLTGEGEVPVRAQFAALASHGYRGFYSFEWEKRWHPTIEEPEVALAHFAKEAARYLGSGK